MSDQEALREIVQICYDLDVKPWQAIEKIGKLAAQQLIKGKDDEKAS